MLDPALQTKVDPQTIPGWGVDADPANNPTYPMRDRSTGHEHGLTWTRPAVQPRRVEILMSVEHKRMPAVFGTSSPPSGLSGAVRRRAFTFSESQWAHWLLLMLADRINVVEGLVQDIAHGRPFHPVKASGPARRAGGRRLPPVPITAGAALAIAAGAIALVYVARRDDRFGL